MKDKKQLSIKNTPHVEQAYLRIENLKLSYMLQNSYIEGV